MGVSVGISVCGMLGAEESASVGADDSGVSVGISVCGMFGAEESAIVGADDSGAVTTETAYACTPDQALLAITTQPDAEFGHEAPPLKRFLSPATLKFEPMRQPGSEEE